MKGSKTKVHICNTTICCYKPASRHSIENWAQCSSAGTPTWKSRRCLTQRNPQHLHALMANRGTPLTASLPLGYCAANLGALQIL